jgi:hypothetical protein
MMTTSTRFLILLSLAISTVFADQVNYTYTQTVTSPSQNCVWGPCQPFDFTIPQFNPELGSLDSVTWTITDSQQYYAGSDNEGPYPLPESYSFTYTEGDSSSLLGLNASDTETVSGTAYSYWTIGASSGWYSDSISASGTAPDSNPFVGTGTMQIAVTPFLSENILIWSVLPAIQDVEDDATLTVTYNDASVVPEPRYSGYGMIGLICLIALCRRFSRRSATV